jgi:hypothetical protein
LALSTSSNSSVILPILFVKLAKTPAIAVATLMAHTQHSVSVAPSLWSQLESEHEHEQGGGKHSIRVMSEEYCQLQTMSGSESCTDICLFCEECLSYIKPQRQIKILFKY